MANPGSFDEAEVERRLDLAEQVLAHRFEDRSLLRRALTHPSVASGPAEKLQYQRLEFLGDSVLGFVVVDEAYHRYPDLAEGVLTRVKVAVVSAPSLVLAARDLGLDSLVFVGGGELPGGGRGMPSVLEDSFEALVAALYLDGGLEAARTFVLRTLGERITPEFALGDAAHPKAALQELLQAVGSSPVYRIVREHGPVHERVFTAEVLLGERILGRGSGGSKKEAEMRAAAEALTVLDEVD